MKKQLIILAMLGISLMASAQIQKGTKVLEGSLSYSSYNYEHFQSFDHRTYENEGQQFVFRPKIGWFVSNRSVLGIGLTYEFEKSEMTSYYSSDNEYTMNQFIINPYFRNYQKIAERFYYTTTIDLGFGFGKEDRSDDTEADLFSLRLAAQPGLSYFINDKWALKANFGRIYYSKTKRKLKNEDQDIDTDLEDKSFGISFSMDSFSIGIGYYF